MNIQKLYRALPYLLALLSGLVWFLSCPPYPSWPTAWIAMVPLMWALRGKRGRSAFFLGWLAGVVAMMGGFPWITDLIVTFGKLPTVVAFPITLLYNSYQALLFGLFALLFTWFRDHTALPYWLNGVLVIAIVEYLFPLIFPWYFSITQAFVPTAIQIAEYTGPIGVSALLLLVNGVVFELLETALLKRKPSLRVALPVALFAVIMGWSVYRRAQVRQAAKSRPYIGVAMVQPNIGIPRERQRWFAVKQVMSHHRMSQLAEELQRKGEIERLDLIVWSESSYPFHVGRSQKHDFTDPDGRINIKRIKRGFTTPLLMGAGTTDRPGDRRYDKKVFNSALLLDAKGEIVGRYDKNWLLMFGEYIPFYDKLSFLHGFFRAHRMSNMTRGNGVNNLVLPDVMLGSEKRSVKLGPLICYEDILPDFGRKSAANEPNMLFNITNDAWFGATQEPYQHLALAVFRSVETRLPMIRNVNIGVSAFIAPDGEMGVWAPSSDPPDDPTPHRGFQEFREDLKAMSFTKKGPGLWRMERWPYSWLVYSKVPVMKGEKTFYVRFGNLFVWLALLAALVIWARSVRPTPARIGLWWREQREARRLRREEKRAAKLKQRDSASQRRTGSGGSGAGKGRSAHKKGRSMKHRGAGSRKGKR